VRRQPGQGEALAVWAVWSATTIATLVTYSRIDSEQLYNVSGSGISGGLSRALVHSNWPIALVAIAAVLTAVGALPRRAWLVAAPAIALCATLPFVVEQDDLDARWANALPAVGVVLALALTVSATRWAGASFAPRLPGDPARIVLAAIVLVLSLPWLAAELGFHLPGDVFMGEELFRQQDGTLEAAVHLGEHHGFHGTLLLLTGLLLSRARPAGGRLAAWQLACCAALAGYGAINFAQDLWHEQLVKRGWVEWKIPSALLPGLRPITFVTVALAAFAWWLLSRERAILRP
jgi:hypothetical protein